MCFVDITITITITVTITITITIPITITITITITVTTHSWDGISTEIGCTGLVPALVCMSVGGALLVKEARIQQGCEYRKFEFRFQLGSSDFGSQLGSSDFEANEFNRDVSILSHPRAQQFALFLNTSLSKKGRLPF